MTVSLEEEWIVMLQTGDVDKKEKSKASEKDGMQI